MLLRFILCYMKKIFQRSVLALMLLFMWLPTVSAQQFSILPVASKGADCTKIINDYEVAPAQSAQIKADKDNILGCAIKTGRISLSMIPYFITYIINFLLGLVGIISVLFIVIGGYRYVLGGLTEEKEKGKNTIMHALMGMGVALLAWTIVNVIINAVTG